MASEKLRTIAIGFKDMSMQEYRRDSIYLSPANSEPRRNEERKHQDKDEVLGFQEDSDSGDEQ